MRRISALIMKTTELISPSHCVRTDRSMNQKTGSDQKPKPSALWCWLSQHPELKKYISVASKGLGWWNLVSACLCTGCKCQHTLARAVSLTWGNFYHTSWALCPPLLTTTVLTKQLPNYTAQNDQSLWMVKKPHYQAKKEEKNTIYFIKLLHDGKQVEERSVPP